MDRRVLRLIIALLIIFILPLSLLYVTKRGTDFCREAIPSDQYIADPSLSMKDFRLVSQRGDTVSTDTVKDKVVVLDFFTASCSDSCDIKHRHLMDVQQAFSKYKHVRLMSVTLDPATDSASALYKYSRKYVGGFKWYFLTGEPQQIKQLADHYGCTIERDANGQIMTPERSLLMDKKGQVRGFYNTYEREEVEKLVNDMYFIFCNQ